MDPAVGRSLVERWRAGRGTAPSIPDRPAPLTSAERGVLTLERLRPGTPVLNLCFAARHTGHLDEDRLDAALTVLLRRHPALRSTFVDGAEGPARVVGDTATIAVSWTDLRHLPSRRAAAAREFAERTAAEPFDLRRGPLVRVRGCRLADDERLLVFAAHHLVCDGASLRILLRELDAAYRGELTGVLPEPPPVPVDPTALAYWRAHLADLPDLYLPGDLTRPAPPTFRAGSVPLSLSDDLVDTAEVLGRAENATLFMVVLAGFQLLLSVHSGQTDFAVGVPEAGRTRPGRHGVVGLLSDLLVVRADLSGRPTFRELVRRARETYLGAFAHRAVPFEELVAALAPGRALDGALVRASLVFHGRRAETTLAGSPLVPVPVARAGLRFGVELHLWREPAGLRGTWDYSAETFTPTEAARMARRMPVLLARVLAQPDRPVDQLDLLTDDDRTLLERWGRGPTPAVPDVGLTELFHAQAARTPAAVAVRDGRRELTYRELDGLSDRLARHLRGLGAGPGETVGIRLARSVDLAVAVLGVLKAGAACLPLDQPRPGQVDPTPGHGPVRTTVTEADLAAARRLPASCVGGGPPAAPEDPAFVFRAVDATGRARAVLVTHRNAAAVVLWGRQTFSPAHLARVLAATPSCDGHAVFELFAPWCAGGTVVVADDARAMLADPPDVTMLCATPSAVQALVAVDALPPEVRAVVLAGEAVPGALLTDLDRTGHVETVVRRYGPAESTSGATWAALRRPERPTPLGVYLPHQRGYILDRALRPVPVGAVGELYLAGSGLSRGYLDQPGPTAARYVADPFAALPGERMYRTGDLVRYRSDGALVRLADRERQVVVRGQRIDPDEVESCLRRHADVCDAVVVPYRDQLVAYLTAGELTGPELDDVRSALLEAGLPAEAVPTGLVVLDTLPRTPSGAVDRAALPAPDLTDRPGGEQPQGPDEHLIAEVWRQVLRIDEVARYDDFFDLGGDSLLAGQVLNRLRRRAGTRLPLRLLFDHPRLADLAVALSSARAAADQPTITPRRPDAEPVLSFDQQRVWLESQLRPGTAYNVHGRRWLRGTLDVPVLERSIRAILDRHDILRTTFPLVDGRPVQRVAAPDPGWRIAVEDRCGPGAAAERLADEQANTSFDLAQGPLLKVLLVRRSDTEHLLSITIHHIVSDGWSVGLFLRELSALYRAGGDVTRADLPALPVQYLDYSVWQRRWLTGERLTKQVEHWRRRLTGAPARLALPAARRPTPGQGAVGGRVDAELGADDVAALHRLCREHEVTPFMAVAAVLTVVLRRWSGQDDLVVGVPVNTRDDTRTSSLIGFFVNTVPLRVGLAGNPEFREVLARVRQAALDGYAKQGDTPFDVLVRELRLPRDPSRAPLFQVLLSMIDDTGAAWQLPGVVVEPAEGPPQPSKVDLTLNVHLTSGGLRLELLYHADRYDVATMRALVGQLRALLRAVTSDPGRGILEYELSGSAATGAATPTPVPAPHSILEQQARHHPRRTAVVDRDGSWTYAQLAAAARRVAEIAGDANRVIVVRRASAGFTAAVLGCGRAGVPFTVVAPDDVSRVAPVACTVLDPGPRAVDGAVDVAALLTAAAAPADAPDAGGEPVPAPGHWAVERLQLGADDRVAALTGGCGPAMSAAVAAGATLVVADDATSGEPDRLVAWLREAGVTVLHLSPARLRAVAAVGAVLPRLRHVVLDNNGDLTAHDVPRARRLAPAGRLVAVYGAGESQQPFAVHEVPEVWVPSVAPLRVPIGVELAGPAALRNAVGSVAAVGEVVQLPGTEDLVRRRPDQVLEFAAPRAGRRLDGRPYADPLDTVAALFEFPDVHDAVVTARTGPHGPGELVAHVVVRDRSINLDRLRQHLVNRLPDYLVPRHVVPVERLPLTPDGDHDLAALLDPAGEASGADTGRAADLPQTAIPRRN
ncbi:Non-ribosomal peptide synthetase component F [Micromonospora sediminicola]|uniref:Non-ribosomal peptide synthetase component F n=1 Tax=Micromonospora sediminicola TaxID=946078 RepID=A0A1A9B9E7_9ACTN|nr:condensation domain-containing protein [Micromonospora sediminicola]SBT65696.1 Non-ribosomal peptide synthetase component F [Micromonospora sediminicola]